MTWGNWGNAVTIRKMNANSFVHSLYRPLAARTAWYCDSSRINLMITGRARLAVSKRRSGRINELP